MHRHPSKLLLTLLLCLCAPVWSWAESNVPHTEAFTLAAALLQARGCDADGCHSLTRDNLAYALVQTAKLSKLQTLVEANPGIPTDEVLECIRTRRWKRKVGRDLETPGSNLEILERLRKIDRAFSRFTRELETRAKGASFSLLLAGSLVKGHFSAASDIDVIVDTKDEDLARWAGGSVWATTHPDHPEGADETIAVADAGDYASLSKKVNLRLLGQSIRVEGKAYEESFLTGIYLRLMKDRGVELAPEDFAASYGEGNFLHRFDRELPIWVVTAIGTAKDWRGKLKELFSSKDSTVEGKEMPEIPEPLTILELGRQERFARSYAP